MNFWSVIFINKSWWANIFQKNTLKHLTFLDFSYFGKKHTFKDSGDKKSDKCYAKINWIKKVGLSIKTVIISFDFIIYNLFYKFHPLIFEFNPTILFIFVLIYFYIKSSYILWTKNLSFCIANLPIFSIKYQHISFILCACILITFSIIYILKCINCIFKNYTLRTPKSLFNRKFLGIYMSN